MEEKAGILPSTKEFNKALNTAMFDDEGEIDGLTQEAFRPVVYKSSTLTELREIGDKYGASVPKRLKKNEVLDVVLKKLSERGELNKELQNKLENQNILLLERFAKDNDIKVSTELKKEEIIEFILSNAKETKAAYYVPSSSAVYEATPEEVKEPEPTPPPVFIAPQPVVGESVTVVDTRQQLDQIARQIEKLTEVMTNKTFEVVVNVPPLEQPQIIVSSPTARIDGSTQNVVENPENALIQELLRDQPDDIESVTDLLVGDKKEFVKKGPMKRGLQIFTGLLSIVFALTYGAAIALAYFMPTFLTDLGTPAEYLTDPLKLYIVIGLGVFAFFALIAGFRFMSKKVSRKEVRVWSVFSLFTGILLVGIFGFITASSVKKISLEQEQADKKSDIEKLAEVISKKSKTRRGGFGRGLFTFIAWLAIITLILVAATIGLFFFPGSSEWPVIGDFLKWVYSLIPSPIA